METLQILYLVLAGAGAVFLAISIFGAIDGDLDFGSDAGHFEISHIESDVDSPSIVSLRSMATFLLAFGIAGTVVIHNGGSLVSQLTWGFISALVVTAIYFLIMKLMYSMQGSSMSSAENLIGKNAIVTIPTAPSGKAQIRIITETGSTEYSCVETLNKKLKQNETVKIISIIDAGTLMVESK